MSLNDKITPERSAGGMDVTTNSAVPDLNNLLVAKMLSEMETAQEANGRGWEDEKPFKNIQQEETKYLREARKLLKKDALLHMKYGGHGLQSVVALAGHLKQRSEQQFTNDLIKNSCTNLIYNSLSENEQLAGIGAHMYIRDNPGLTVKQVSGIEKKLNKEFHQFPSQILRGQDGDFIDPAKRQDRFQPRRPRPAGT